MSLLSLSSYILFVGGRWAQGQQRAKSNNVGKENTGYLRQRCLSTDNYSPPREKVRFPGTKTLKGPGSSPQPPASSLQNGPGQVDPCKDTELTSPFNLTWRPLRKSSVGLAPNRYADLINTQSLRLVYSSLNSDLSLLPVYVTLGKLFLNPVFLPSYKMTRMIGMG